MGGSAPEPTDPQKVANAQTGGNVATAVANAYMGNVNQVTPYGGLQYKQIGTKTVKQGNKTYKIPQFEAVQTLSPIQQDILNQTQGAQFNIGQLANEQSGFLRNYLLDEVDLSGDNLRQYMNTNYDDRFNEQWDHQASSLENRLANQGIAPGSAAYDRAVREFQQNRGDAYTDYQGGLYSQATQNLLTERNQPLNEISALLSGSQVQQPNFIPTQMPNIANTDYASIYGNYDQQRMNAYNAKQASLGGLFSGVGSMLAISDERAKKNIEQVGTINTHNVYDYNYIDEPDGAPKHTGVLAGEVEQTRPDAVINMTDGDKPARAIDYGALMFGEMGRAKDEDVIDLIENFNEEYA